MLDRDGGEEEQVEIPHPLLQWREFLDLLKANIKAHTIAVSSNSTIVWDPMTKSLQPWVDPMEILKIYNLKAGSKKASKACSIS